MQENQGRRLCREALQGLHTGISQAIFTISFLPLRQGSPSAASHSAASHCGFSQDSSGHRRVAPRAGRSGKWPSSPSATSHCAGPSWGLGASGSRPGRERRPVASATSAPLGRGRVGAGAEARAGIPSEIPGAWLSQESLVYQTDIPWRPATGQPWWEPTFGRGGSLHQVLEEQ